MPCAYSVFSRAMTVSVVISTREFIVSSLRASRKSEATSSEWSSYDMVVK